MLIFCVTLCLSVKNFLGKIYKMNENNISNNDKTIDNEAIEKLTEDIIASLKTVYDPEIPVDIYELGLIYKVDLDDNSHVNIDMTLTAPGCPVAGEMPKWVEDAVSNVIGVSGATVTMVFDPPWDMVMMSEEAKVALNML
ncbi:MAG: FeS assembly SUF system protein [Alphaproteobacteria bacterium]|mgnify:FL=1|jgi:FeS assembly SUF system protein